MKNQIIIHAAGKQTRIALLENGELAQLFIESPENQRTVGDIYLAEVRKVMGGIRAAFIDMNTPKDAFLHFSDLGEHLDDYLVMLNGKEVLAKESMAKLADIRASKDPNQTNKSGTNTEEQNLLGNMLKPGQKVLVQIVKEPIGSKGPRVSTNISIAGRFLVLIPMGDYVAVSKRIKSYKERRVLRQTVADLLPDGFGVIVRTVAEGQDSKMIEEDLKDVLEKWNNIMKDVHTAKPPALLHRDLEMTESLVRDLFAKDFDRILVDDPKMHKSLRSYVSKIAPSMLPNIELYKGSGHIFDHMRIMQDVESVFSPRVKMPSGGYLIFEQTEAMYVVDVNSGRYAAKKAQEDNSLKTNLEAAREIAKQLRLRDIGGIIVVDFIDLRDDVNRKKVYDELKKEFRKDRAKTNLLPMSDFGLVQITRQRIRPSVVKSVSRVCPMCGGGGSIVSQNTLLSDIEAWLHKFKNATRYRSVDLLINPYMKGMLAKGWVSQHFKWMMKYRLRIGLIEDQTLSMNDYKFTLSGSDVDITETILMDQSIEQAIKAAEQRIAELESELKRDSTTLDIYKNDRKNDRRDAGGRQQRDDRDNRRSDDRGRDDRENRNDRGPSRSDDQRDNRNRDDRNTRDDRNQRDDRNSRDDRNQRSDRPNDNRGGRPAPTPTPAPAPAPESKEISKPEQSTASEPKETRAQAQQRRNQKISKYYKKSDDADVESTTDGNEVAEQPKAPVKPEAKDKDVNADKSASKSQDSGSTTSNEDVIPEELSHLRSALEVAKEYKLKREKELNGGATTTTDSKESKSVEKSTTEETPVESKAEKANEKPTKGASSKKDSVAEKQAETSEKTSKDQTETNSNESGDSEASDVAAEVESEDTPTEKAPSEATSKILTAVLSAKKPAAKPKAKPKPPAVRKKPDTKATPKKKPAVKKGKSGADDEIVDDFGSLSDDRPVKGD
jgi:ribonuclease G